MLVATLKSHVLHEEKLGGYNIKLIRLDSSDSVELEVKKDGHLVVRKKMEDMDRARKFIDEIRKKFKEKDNKSKKFNAKKTKEARINSDNPKAFSTGSPSENPFSGDGPGGLLTHMEHMPNKRNPYNKRKKNITRDREKWDDVSGREENDGWELSRWGPDGGVSRDSGPDRDGFEKALNHEDEGHRPALPKGEDSIDVMKNPDEYNPIYDQGYPGDRTTEQDIADRDRHKRQLDQQRKIQMGQDYFSVILNVQGKEKRLTNLTFQEALQKSKENPGSKIVKENKGV